MRTLKLGDPGGEHFFEGGEGDAGFVAEARDGAVAGVEIGVARASAVSGEVAEVIIADALAEVEVGTGAAEGFDPGVLVGRNGLGGELAADPIGFFGQDDAEAVAGGGQRGRAAARATADDDEVGGEFLHSRGSRHGARGWRRLRLGEQRGSCGGNRCGETERLKKGPSGMAGSVHGRQGCADGGRFARLGVFHRHWFEQRGEKSPTV